MSHSIEFINKKIFSFFLLEAIFRRFIDTSPELVLFVVVFVSWQVEPSASLIMCANHSRWNSFSFTNGWFPHIFSRQSFLHSSAAATKNRMLDFDIR
jgi:hypothetical protein